MPAPALYLADSVSFGLQGAPRNESIQRILANRAWSSSIHGSFMLPMTLDIIQMFPVVNFCLNSSGFVYSWHHIMRFAGSTTVETSKSHGAQVLDQECAIHPDMGGHHIQTMVNTLWSFTSMRWHPVRSLQRLLDALHKGVRRMKSVELCNTLWVCARLGHHPGDDMLMAVDTRIQQLVGPPCTAWARGI